MHETAAVVRSSSPNHSPCHAFATDSTRFDLSVSGRISGRARGSFPVNSPIKMVWMVFSIAMSRSRSGPSAYFHYSSIRCPAASELTTSTPHACIGAQPSCAAGLNLTISPFPSFSWWMEPHTSSCFLLAAIIFAAVSEHDEVACIPSPRQHHGNVTETCA